MSSGRIHSAASLGAAISVGTSWVAFRYLGSNPIPVSVGIVLQIVMSPDQDVDAGYIGDYYMRKLWLGWWWKLLWNPYKLIVKHRSFLSHSIIFGTANRILYLISPILFCILALRFDLIPRSLVSQISSLPLIAGALFMYNECPSCFVDLIIGLCIGDIIHIIFDKL